jgi:hypothetical protein
VTGPRPRLLGIALAGALAMLAFGGCEASFSVGDGLSGDEVAEEAESALNEATREEGTPPFPKITCPEDLDEEVGAKTTCYSNFDGSRHRIFVKVASIEGDDVTLDFNSEGRPTR